MHYEGTVIRPPSEADSIILQVTTGCSHNACTFCGAYSDKLFRIKDPDVVDEDIDFAAQYCRRQKTVFLADGNALVLSQAKLVRLLKKIKEKLKKLLLVPFKFENLGSQIIFYQPNGEYENG